MPFSSCMVPSDSTLISSKVVSPRLTRRSRSLQKNQMSSRKRDCWIDLTDNELTKVVEILEDAQ